MVEEISLPFSLDSELKKFTKMRSLKLKKNNTTAPKHPKIIQPVGNLTNVE